MKTPDQELKSAYNKMKRRWNRRIDNLSAKGMSCLDPEYACAILNLSAIHQEFDGIK